MCFCTVDKYFNHKCYVVSNKTDFFYVVSGKYHMKQSREGTYQKHSKLVSRQTLGQVIGKLCRQNEKLCYTNGGINSVCRRYVMC